jgi:serine/threonine-protein kinase
MSPQQSIAHYRITSKLGAGGMGEVWRATDTKLGRDVALKILPASFANDPARMARFEREAKALASLNHPHIAQIYGIEEGALVMELVEGEPLKGPLPVVKAVEYAGQILDALDAAHQKGIVHRDLKPPNILVTKQGIKLLDFGLAKLADGLIAGPDETVTQGLTQQGQIVGTLQYMSPEQLNGKEVDSRSDLFSFGCVLYEMLGGKRAFDGKSAASVIAAVLEREPEPLKAAPPLERVIKRALAKDAEQRFQSARDLNAALSWALENSPAVARPSGLRVALVAAAAMTIVAVTTSALLWRATRPIDHPLIRLSVDLGPEALTGLNLTVAISPDGRRLVYPARGPDGKQILATRLLDQVQPALLPGTENARNPFFSPDGQWIGFIDGTQLKKTSTQGGTPVTLSNIGRPQIGGSWGEDGNIVTSLSLSSGLVRLPDDGGKPQPFTKLDAAELTHRWPQVLPGGKVILFTASTSISSMEDASIKAVDLSTGVVKVVWRGGYYGRYLPSGHLVYVHQGALFGIEFNPARLETRGAPVPVLDDLAGDSLNGSGQFDFSAAPSGAGTLIYVAGKSGIGSWAVASLDASGNQSVIAPSGVYYNPAFSPDGRRVAMDVGGPKGTDIFVYDVASGNSTRLTFDGASDRPVWAPDGMHIIFQSSANGHALLWVRRDGANQPVLLWKTSYRLIPWSLSHDGRRLACWEPNPTGPNGIWIVPLDASDPDHPKAGQPEPFRYSQASETVPMFSPDGRWIAYRSNESGADEIYVRASSGSGGHWQISDGGGMFAFWAPGGHDLFYETSDNRIMIIDYTTNGASFVKGGKPRVWFGQRIYSPGRGNLDLAPDGKRFAIFRTTEEAESSPRVVFLLNFFDFLQRRIATGGK